MPPHTDSQPTIDQKIRNTAVFLAVLQFFFVLTWTVYAAYLPALLADVGIGKDKAGWVLLTDQVLFAVFDVLAGFLADRAFRSYARLGPWLLGLTTLSCVAFLALPHIATWQDASWRAPAFLALTAAWAISSSALRAPAFAMFSRHMPPAGSSSLASGLLAGMAFAGILAPYLGTVLKTVDPHLPFALSSLTLLVVASGLIRAEKTVKAIKAPAAAATIAPLPMTIFYPLLAMAALAFQISFNLNAAPRYLRYTSAANLVWLMPVFWIGFNIACFAGKSLARKIEDSSRRFSVGCVTAGIGAFIHACVPGLSADISSQLIAGLGWGITMAAAFAIASECGRPTRMATATGLLFAMLAAATFARIGITLAGWPTMPDRHGSLSLLPMMLWPIAANIAHIAARKRKT